MTNIHFPRAVLHFGGRRAIAVPVTDVNLSISFDEPDRKDSTLTNEDFYILWEPTSALPPRRRFYSEDHAFAIAEKMAEGHPGKKFYVMHVVGVAKPQTVVVERFDRVTEQLPGGTLTYDPNGPIAKMPTAGPPDWEESATIHAAGFAPVRTAPERPSMATHNLNDEVFAAGYAPMRETRIHPHGVDEY